MADLINETRSELIDKIVKTLSIKSNEIAEMVELYYDCQTFRISNANKERTEPPSDLAEWLNYWLQLGEKVIAGKLKKWVESLDSPLEAKWAYAQNGIGPIIAAGLAAHIDVAKAETPSALWKFAGQSPGFDRKIKGQKLPYNARLKVLCWKLGESFVKVSGKEGALYGKLYAEFKAEEIKRNEQGRYKEVAKRELASKKFRDDTATRKRLEKGMLSDGHLHARAKRRTVKIFLCHFWIRAREARGLDIRTPYVQQFLGHDGIIESAA